MSNPPDAPDTGELAATVCKCVHPVGAHYANGCVYCDCPAVPVSDNRTKDWVWKNPDLLPSDSGELERLLSVIEANRAEVTRLYDSITRDFVPPDSDFQRHLEPIREARKSVLDLFERLQNRIAELDEELKWMTDRILSARFLPEGSCGFFWRTDYGPAYCDQGKDHAGSHRCWGSQGEMRFDPLSSLRSSR